MDDTQVPNSFGIFCPDLKICEKRYAKNPYDLLGMYFEILTKIYQGLMQKYEENDKMRNYNIQHDTSFCMCCNQESEELVRHHDISQGNLSDSFVNPAIQRSLNLIN